MQRSRRLRRARWAMWILTLALGACGGGSSDPVDDDPFDFYPGTAEIGELDSDGLPITDEAGCIREATRRAFDMLVAAGHFDEGWSTGPPAHRED